jgi:hypothetical protein
MTFLPELGPAWATIFGAIVGACSGIGGGLITVWLQLRLERLKWPKAREDALAADLRLSVHQFSLKMAAAVHSMGWLTWLAQSRAESVTLERIDGYDKELHALLPEISGMLTAISALDREAFDRLRPLAEEVYDLDVRVGDAGLLIYTSQEAAAGALGGLPPRCYGIRAIPRGQNRRHRKHPNLSTRQ